MKLSEAAQYLPFVEAAAQGRTLQYRNGGSEWQDIDNPTFDASPGCYRIKPEPPKPLRRWSVKHEQTKQVFGCFESYASAMEFAQATRSATDTYDIIEWQQVL